MRTHTHTEIHKGLLIVIWDGEWGEGVVGNPYGEGPRHLGPRSTKPNNRCNARSLAIRASACASFGSKRTRVTERVTTGTRQAGTARGKWWGVGSANSIVAGLPMGANNERDTQPQSTLDSSLVPLFFYLPLLAIVIMANSGQTGPTGHPTNIIIIIQSVSQRVVLLLCSITHLALRRGYRWGRRRARGLCA